MRSSAQSVVQREQVGLTVGLVGRGVGAESAQDAGAEAVVDRVDKLPNLDDLQPIEWIESTHLFHYFLLVFSAHGA